MATRKERREAKKMNLPVRLEYKMIEDLANEGNGAAKILQQMLNEEIYITRLIVKAHKNGFITDKEFVHAGDVYDLPLGMDGKDLLLADYVVEEMNRFNLSTTIAKKGDTLTAFLVDRYDDLYEAIKTSVSENFKEEELFQKEFVNAIMDDNASYAFTMISKYLDENPKVEKLVKEVDKY